MDPGFATPQSPLMSPAGSVSDLTICAVSDLRPAPCQATCGGRKPHPDIAPTRQGEDGVCKRCRFVLGAQLSEAEVLRWDRRG